MLFAENNPDMNNDMAKSDTDMITTIQETNATSIGNINNTKGDNTGDDCFESADEICPVGVPCDDLDADCLLCDFDNKCAYGSKDFHEVQCRPKPRVNCTVRSQNRAQCCLL